MFVCISKDITDIKEKDNTFNSYLSSGRDSHSRRKVLKKNIGREDGTVGWGNQNERATRVPWTGVQDVRRVVRWVRSFETEHSGRWRWDGWTWEERKMSGQTRGHQQRSRRHIVKRRKRVVSKLEGGFSDHLNSQGFWEPFFTTFWEERCFSFCKHKIITLLEECS